MDIANRVLEVLLKSLGSKFLVRLRWGANDCGWNRAVGTLSTQPDMKGSTSYEYEGKSIHIHPQNPARWTLCNRGHPPICIGAPLRGPNRKSNRRADHQRLASVKSD